MAHSKVDTGPEALDAQFGAGTSDVIERIDYQGGAVVYKDGKTGDDLPVGALALLEAAFGFKLAHFG
jgi:hypothetical protein